ncbi:uncharacterized protein LOC113211230 isoform X1 [Frankliniella occidentalis]|uniref:Uncharacterized protein LOC113211230 isoform X1 n=1 Tax=Frankliniella occidentalis TaxID=133901 RepID=A0A9C6UF34_FRAOC|nr:uncharacterized protein LOC113211230 isoform X1 [Frankliniella occidentalis]
MSLAPAQHSSNWFQFNFAATSARITTEARVTTTYCKTETIISLAQPDHTTYIISKFAEWFYNKVNQSGGFRYEDFWQDININLMLKDNFDTEKVAQRATNSAGLLNQISGAYKLNMKPNSSPQGIWARGKEADGLLQVLVCGTLHQCSPAQHCQGIQFGPCLGMFENLFLIAYDRSINSWKIKKLNGILKSAPYMQQLPTIADSELINSIVLRFNNVRSVIHPLVLFVGVCSLLTLKS